MATMRLSIFAFHVSQIMREDAPKEFTLHPCEGVDAKIEIEKNTNDFLWNTVKVNGKWCGNRCGGVQAFTELVAAANPTIVMD